ncbi:MAG: ATP synthase subunit C [Anaerolineae bacterium]
MRLLIGVFAGLIPTIPAIVYIIRGQRALRKATVETVVGLGVLNLVVALAMVGIGLTWIFAPEAAWAAELMQDGTQRDPLAYVGAAISVAVGSIGAGYAVAAVGSAAVGTIAERPEIFGRALLFVGLAEGVAIYGLIIAFIMLG